MPRLKLTIAYVGTQYHGWQTQARKNASPLPTIQNIIEDAVAHVLGERVHVHGAGRTDAGVHAEAQVAHLDVPESRARMDWQLALNTLLPRDIRIADAVLVPDTFHAQHSAVRKTYEYRLWLSKRYTPPQLFPFVWACGSVDVERMDEGSRYLLGKRDFASLKNAGTDRSSLQSRRDALFPRVVRVGWEVVRTGGGKRETFFRKFPSSLPQAPSYLPSKTFDWWGGGAKGVPLPTFFPLTS